MQVQRHRFPNPKLMDSGTIGLLVQVSMLRIKMGRASEGLN